MKLRQLGFSVDLSRCVGCRACELACQHKHPDTLQGYRRVRLLSEKSREQGFLTMACNHCVSPECMRVCPVGCYEKRRDGIVLHNSVKCIGCGRCVGACPFHAPVILPRTGKVDKCDFCWERLQAGKMPLCVEACPVEALGVCQIDCDAEIRRDNMVEQYTQPALKFIKGKEPICFWRGEENKNEERK